MGRNQFLFEFPLKTVVDHIVKRDWLWKSHKLCLKWWSPTSGAISNSENLEQIWIKMVGLPLHLWSQRIFKEVGDLCGGWLQTVEETKLRNHLKWARIKVKGDGDSIPKTVDLIHEGFHLQNPDLVWSVGTVCRRWRKREESYGPTDKRVTLLCRGWIWKLQLYVRACGMLLHTNSCHQARAHGKISKGIYGRERAANMLRQALPMKMMIFEALQILPI